MRRPLPLLVPTLPCSLHAAPVPAADALPKAGASAPDFRLQDLNGHWRSLAGSNSGQVPAGLAGLQKAAP